MNDTFVCGDCGFYRDTPNHELGCTTGRAEHYDPPTQPNELTWAAVDFDGTLAYSTWSIENPNAAPGQPIRENVVKLNQLIDAGYKIVIHTSRSWADVAVLEHWFEHYSIHYDQIVCGKLLARVYVDDRNVLDTADNWLPRG